MDIRKTVEQTEKDIDESFAASKLLVVGYAQAVWTILTVNEDYYYMVLQKLSDAQMFVVTDNRVNALTHPLRTCLSRCEPRNAMLRKELVAADYEEAWEWLRAAEDYRQFCTIFSLWHRKRVDIEIGADGRLLVENRNNKSHEYEAYNRLVLRDGRPNVPITEPDDALINLLRSRTKVGDDWFNIKAHQEIEWVNLMGNAA